MAVIESPTLIIPFEIFSTYMASHTKRNLSLDKL
jgi:hypothetical protein